MNILSLNVNGLGKGDFKSSWINNIISKHNINFVGIQESKWKNPSEMDVRRIWGSNDFEFVSQWSLGKSGGLNSIWNKNIFQKTYCILRQDCIIIKGYWIESGEEVYFINIYANQSRERRKELWNFISAALCNWQGQTFIVGDFNEVRESNERRGSIFDRVGATELDKFIKNNELEDLKIGGEILLGSTRSVRKWAD